MNKCAEDYHVPTKMMFVPPATYWLFCDCQTERCGNVQMTRQGAASYGLPIIFESGDERRQYEAGQ